MALACNIRIISSVAEAAMLGERTLRGDNPCLTTKDDGLRAEWQARGLHQNLR